MPETIKHCEHCKNSYTTKYPLRSKYCCRKCHENASKAPSRSVPCNQCGKLGKKQDRTQGLCRTCLNSKRSGSNSSRWRGGSRYNLDGRFGRDLQGLSWRVQRRLAWDKDKLTCQMCGFHKDGWKPDVHHITPYRFSKSHAITNLICYCRSCHLKVEAELQNWTPPHPKLQKQE